MMKITDYNGRKYREVMRPAKVGELVRVFGHYSREANGIFTVKKVVKDNNHGDVINYDTNENQGIFGTPFYEGKAYVVLEPLADENSSDMIANIATLTLKVASLEKRIAELEGERKSSEPPTRPREATVEQAREDVERLITVNSYHQLDFEFIVNRKKRTVVCLRKFYGEVVSRGFAKCAPDDVFNSHIGKAIAIRRALDYPVPAEYTQAPAPEDAQAGDVIRIRDGGIRMVVEDISDVVTGKTSQRGSLNAIDGTVVDDSRTGDDEREAYGI